MRSFDIETHMLGSNLQAAANSLRTPTTADQRLTVPLPLERTLKCNSRETLQSSDPQAVAYATFQPICACQVCTGSNELESLWFTPTHTHYCHYTRWEHFHTPSHTFHFPAVLISRAIKTTIPPTPPHHHHHHYLPHYLLIKKGH